MQKYVGKFGARDDMMREKVINTIEKYKMIDKGDGIVVGLSGGPDSACLIHLLCNIREIYDIRIYAVHLNHMIRGEEALRDEQYSKGLAQSLGVPFYARRMEVEKYARENRLSSEEAGRRLRYGFFDDIALLTGSNKIALAHNMNDQAETMIMRFIRGSGISGIGGIKPVRDLRYIRPLISCSREEIEEYCGEYDLRPVIDSTNKENIYTRNRIRLELIPYIKENFNPNIVESLFKASEIIRDEDDYINLSALIEIEKIRGQDGIYVDNFNLLHRALKRRIIRILIEGTKGSLEGIESKHIEECIEFISRGHTGKSINLPDSLECTVEYDVFKIASSHKEGDFEYSIAIPGSIKIEEKNVTISTRIIENNECIIENNALNTKDSPFIKYFDYDKIKGSLKARNKRDGDFMYPKGMQGRKKIKDIFIDKKIPRPERGSITLVAAGSEILWIVGLRDTRNYKPDEKTRRVLEIEVKGCKR